ncbi:MAG: hypothetical protein FWG68_04020 [Defluviitaleaceae bacterium]|nr:hypothetical protein [Defluviitaleaceae bacterium]
MLNNVGSINSFSPMNSFSIRNVGANSALSNMMQNSMFPQANLFNMLNFGRNMATSPFNFRTSLFGVRSNAELLLSTLNDMRGVGRNAQTPFGRIRPVPEDTNILQITNVDTNRLRNSNVNSLSVNVMQVAQAQQNQGAALTANSLATSAGFTAGANQISINVGNSRFDFNFNVSATDTVRQVQDRIAAAVNNRNIGVRAAITTEGSGAGQTSTLTFQSAQTGVNVQGQPNFTVSGTNNSASLLGVDTITRQAQNAEFRVNRNGFTGSLQTSRTNDVNLGFGISATLREAGLTQIALERDETRQMDSFRDMVSAINGMLESMGGAPGGRLHRGLINTLRSSSVSLNRIGISVDRGGFLTINERRFNAAAESGALESFAMRDRVGSPFGFINRLTRSANDIRRNPGGFVNLNQNWWFTQNQMFATQMNQAMNTGLLFQTMM